jgi:hypothetical protein
VDYDLSRLSWRTFEQLIQALSVNIFGPGVVIFGDGRDGGREATYQGNMSYGHDGSWDGYLVVQAKFRQRPEGTTPDGVWALSELKKELQSYLARPERARPDYYIYATNVVLAPTEGGAKDECVKLLSSYQDRLGIRAFDLWDYDKLRSYLDVYETVRRTYRAWITPSDVLADLLDDHDWNATAALTSYLSKEMVGDQYVNLEQAGHSVEDKIPLGRVFVDLPTESSQFRLDNRQPGIVKRIIKLASARLDSTSLLTPVEISDALEDDALPLTQRLVLVGGPGQGKTTIGQFVCQLFRGALLAQALPQTLSNETVQALDSVISHCANEDIDLPVVRRFPIRVILNKYASALASPDGPNALLDYIAALIQKRSSEALPAPAFHTWLAAYPWLLILDGLDEVPASSNRDEVMRTLTDFWADVAARNIDVLVVATTRPQGYNDDFAPDAYHHEHLAPLTPPEALGYGRRLTEARYGGDEERQTKVLKRLKRAASTDTTARLMTSPLQVTIMTALVDRMGQPPQERWSLFNEYYNVIFHREMERDIAAAAILRDYKPDVDAIHRRVGLVLQALAEQRSHTEARLSVADLAGIIGTRLSEEGHRDMEGADSLENAMLDAAAERLVFLVGLEADRIGFEIRSLQEFMAAEGLMDGTDEQIRERLAAIAIASSWRNVFLFAAGKCFAERQHLRETIYAICGALNTTENDYGIAAQELLGSSLALELLEDGPARRQPKFARMFMQQALARLRVALPASWRALAYGFEDRFQDLYEKAISEALDAHDVVANLGALTCLLALSERGVGWADTRIEEAWPTAERVAPEFLAELLQRARPSRPFGAAASSLSDRQLESLLSVAAENVDDPYDWHDLVRALLRDNTPGDSLVVRLNFVINEDFAYIVTGMRDTRFVAVSGKATLGAPLVAGERFSVEPTSSVLANELRHLADVPFNGRWLATVAHYLPWPLGACLHAAKSEADLRRFADLADAGALGSEHAWTAAEERWRAAGISGVDLDAAAKADFLWSEDIEEVGFPLPVAGWQHGGKVGELLGPLEALRAEMRDPTVRGSLASASLSVLGTAGVQKGVALAEVARMHREASVKGTPWLRVQTLANVTWPRRNAERWELAEYLGRHIRFGSLDGAGFRPGVNDGAMAKFTERIIALSHQGEIGLGLVNLIAVSMVKVRRQDLSGIADRVTDEAGRSGAFALVEVGSGAQAAEMAEAAHRFVASVDKEPGLLTVLQSLAQADAAFWTPFVVEVSRAASVTKWRSRRRIAALIAELGENRTSPLVSSETWDSLGLFDRAAIGGAVDGAGG